MTVPIEDGAPGVHPAARAHVRRAPQPGLAEENLQARIRGTLLMAISNKFDWMVLTTGNKSEMATGYSTLYGDMAGGFAVIKDVPKMLVYALCVDRNRRAGRELIPESVLEKPPSAELRPDQQDEDSLPPYPVLDEVLEDYVEEDLSAAEIEAEGFDRETVDRVVAARRPQRVQAPPGPAGHPRLGQGVRQGPQAPDHQPLAGLTGRPA